MELTILASSLSNEDVRRQASKLAGKLGLVPRVVTSPEEVPDSPTVALVATGGTEDLIEALLNRSPAVLLLHWSAYNSLAAVLEARASSIHVNRAKEAVRAFEQLVGSKVLVVNGKCSWIRGPDPTDLPYINTIQVDLEDLRSVEPEELPAERFRRYGIDPSNLKREFLNLAGRLHALARRHNVDAITGDCFTLYEEFGAVPCLYFSVMDVRYCCEGDPVALVTTLTLSEARPFIGNVVELDRYGVRLAHCACPMELLGGEFEVIDHMETGAPHAVKGTLLSGECVLARYPHVFEASSVDTRWREDQCRVQAQLLVKEFEPEGNHHCVAFGVDPELLSRLFEAVHLNPEPSPQ